MSEPTPVYDAIRSAVDASRRSGEIEGFVRCKDQILALLIAETKPNKSLIKKVEKLTWKK